jgi:hypothetical protein
MTTPRMTAMWSGIAMLVLGGLGLFFGGGSLPGLFPMSLWLAIGFVITGVLLWYASTGDELTHSFSMVIGLVYGILAVIGLLVRGFNLFGILPIEGWNIALFIALGVAMLYDWISTPTSRPISGMH